MAEKITAAVEQCTTKVDVLTEKLAHLEHLITTMHNDVREAPQKTSVLVNINRKSRTTTNTPGGFRTQRMYIQNLWETDAAFRKAVDGFWISEHPSATSEDLKKRFAGAYRLWTGTGGKFVTDFERMWKDWQQKQKSAAPPAAATETASAGSAPTVSAPAGLDQL